MYKLHADHVIKGSNSDQLSTALQVLEAECVKKMELFQTNSENSKNLKIDSIMEDYVMKEVNLYVNDRQNED